MHNFLYIFSRNSGLVYVTLSVCLSVRRSEKFQKKFSVCLNLSFGGWNVLGIVDKDAASDDANNDNADDNDADNVFCLFRKQMKTSEVIVMWRAKRDESPPTRQILIVKMKLST